MAKDPAILAHQEWLGYVQPVGLVVSIPAMLDANRPGESKFCPGPPSLSRSTAFYRSEGEPNP